MGTFHQSKGELHGITVVVDTHVSTVYVGRCDEVDDEGVMLLDVDVHEDGRDGLSKAEYLERAARFGVWKMHDRLRVPSSQVAEIYPLGEHPTRSGKAARSTHPSQGAAAPAPPSDTRAASAPDEQREMPAEIVTLTENARAEVARLLVEEKREGVGLRLAVSGGGCSGLSYKLSFDLREDHDRILDCGDFHVYLDSRSLVYLRGVTLDYQKGLNGRGFVFSNPNASNTCGCGESFAV